MSKVFIIGFLIFTFLFVGNVSGQQKSEGDIQTVDFCELFKNPNAFNGKTVRVKAIYRYGYEWSDIFCLACKVEGLMRMDFGDDFTSKTKRRIRKKIKYSDRGKTVMVVAVGKMTVRQSGFKKFFVDYFESAEVLAKDSSNDVVDKLPDKIKQREKCLNRMN